MLDGVTFSLNIDMKMVMVMLIMSGYLQENNVEEAVAAI